MGWLFAAARGLSVLPRVIVMLGFQPAVLFKLDSYDYLWDAAHLRPNPVNPGGYTILLWPLHSPASARRRLPRDARARLSASGPPQRG